MLRTNDFLNEVIKKKERIEQEIHKLLLEIKEEKVLLAKMHEEYILYQKTREHIGGLYVLLKKRRGTLRELRKRVRAMSRNVAALFKGERSKKRRQRMEQQKEDIRSMLNAYSRRNPLPKALINRFQGKLNAFEVEKVLMHEIRKYKTSQRHWDLYFMHLGNYGGDSCGELFKHLPSDKLRKIFLRFLLKGLIYQPQLKRNLKQLYGRYSRYERLLSLFSRYKGQDLLDAFESLYFSQDHNLLKLLFKGVDLFLASMLEQAVERIRSNLRDILSLDKHIENLITYNKDSLVREMELNEVFNEALENLKAMRYKEREEMLELFDRYKATDPFWVKDYNLILKEYDNFGGPDEETITAIFKFLWDDYLNYKRDNLRAGIIRAFGHMKLLQETYPGYKIYKKLFRQLRIRMIDPSVLKAEVEDIKSQKSKGLTRKGKEKLDDQNINIPLSEQKPRVISPEFIHLLFFKQRNLIIYPLMKEKDLRRFSTFTVGHTIINLISTNLESLKSQIEEAIGAGDHPLFIGYGFGKKTTKRLLYAYPTSRFIFNTKEKFSAIETRLYPSVVFYDWDFKSFFNNDFSKADLRLEKTLCKTTGTDSALRERLGNAKMIADSYYFDISRSLEPLYLDEFFERNNKIDCVKVLQFLQHYYHDIEFTGRRLLPKSVQSGNG